MIRMQILSVLSVCQTIVQPGLTVVAVVFALVLRRKDACGGGGGLRSSSVTRITRLVCPFVYPLLELSVKSKKHGEKRLTIKILHFYGKQKAKWAPRKYLCKIKVSEINSKCLHCYQSCISGCSNCLTSKRKSLLHDDDVKAVDR